LAKIIREAPIVGALTLSGEQAEFMSYVRRDGRITIPTEVRAALDIKDGDLVKCRITKVKPAR